MTFVTFLFIMHHDRINMLRWGYYVNVQEKYKQMKTVFIVFFIIISLIIVGSIYQKYSIPSQTSFHRFGVTYMTMNNPFYEVINNELKKEIEVNGDKLITLDPALDIDKQIEQIYYFIEQKVDGIFVNPIDSQKIKPAILAAKNANIPVIAIDSPITDLEILTSTIVSDNYDAGVQCARDMMKRKSFANIILLKHSAVQSAKDRIDGFLDTIKNNSLYHVINEGECEGQLELAMPIMEKMLKETPDVDVVMALNDPSALGALAALESVQKKDVIVYGVDGTPDVKSLIQKNNNVAGTVAQSPIQIGKKAALTMYDYLSGKEVNHEQIISVTLINRSNIKDFDEMGWQ